ncbi:MAG: hypothetical protein PWQ30_1037, partial [Euryarchaeota archaeon]|nr:hypothetical protein [Euryarchaeota archaeon]
EQEVVPEPDAADLDGAWIKRNH